MYLATTNYIEKLHCKSTLWCFSYYLNSLLKKRQSCLPLILTWVVFWRGDYHSLLYFYVSLSEGWTGSVRSQFQQLITNVPKSCIIEEQTAIYPFSLLRWSGGFRIWSAIWPWLWFVIYEEVSSIPVWELKQPVWTLARVLKSALPVFAETLHFSCAFADVTSPSYLQPFQTCYHTSPLPGLSWAGGSPTAHNCYCSLTWSLEACQGIAVGAEDIIA